MDTRTEWLSGLKVGDRVLVEQTLGPTKRGGTVVYITPSRNRFDVVIDGQVDLTTMKPLKTPFNKRGQTTGHSWAYRKYLSEAKP